ncbi:MAG TPA: ABC transporter permease [Woeseiaceae bacterium]|nr:ABC transporter permease [Woeseiaceae bacterium]
MRLQLAMPVISLFALSICLLPIAGVVWIAHKWSGRGQETAVASLRMLVQLLAVGFVLVFLFASPNPLVGLAVVAVMVLASAAIGVRTVVANRRAAFMKAIAAIGIAGSAVLAFVLFAVLTLHDPWYQPRFIIPLAGMIFSNAMTAITLAAERLAREEAAGVDYNNARGVAWNAALIPQINALLAVGIVSLPGMMTGQILSGVDPLTAVRYQIVVMAMILQSAAFAVAIFLWLSKPEAAT